MATLSNNQKLFCQEYIKQGMNATKAYMQVYKTKTEESARKSASRLLTNVDIKNYIAELQSKVEDKAIVKIEDIVKELYDIAFVDRTKISKLTTEKVTDEETGKVYERRYLDFADTDKLDEKTKKAIASYKHTATGISIETYDKLKALELLGKYMGMFKEPMIDASNSNVSINIELTDE